MALSEERIHEIQKSVMKSKIKKDREFKDINLIINSLQQANGLYFTGNMSKSDFIECIIEAKSLMIDSLTKEN